MLKNDQVQHHIEELVDAITFMVITYEKTKGDENHPVYSKQYRSLRTRAAKLLTELIAPFEVEPTPTVAKSEEQL